ncbi:MAG: fumarylacetoacetate hydrolase family protein [Alphaproteobacteria bacterium]|nr:fumarylacetoacetate hydrolase family protein [Alphaproteobacteria bacterium]MDE2339827.1 fumarylacetoacetate hydrolase family protein [Alphaproteobacteria bacterium]
MSNISVKMKNAVFLMCEAMASDPEKLEMIPTVDGVVQQRGRANDRIFKIADQIEYLTTVMTLFPGDIITTGTPSGVAAVDQNWFKPVQVCRIEIEGLGAIENRIVQQA